MVENTEIKKPRFLKIVSVIALTYHIVFLLIFISGIVFNRFFTTALENYFPNEIGDHEVLYFGLVGTFCYLLSVSGLIFIRNLKRIGLFLYISSILMYFTVKFIFWDISYINLVINLLFILILSSYARRYH